MTGSKDIQFRSDVYSTETTGGRAVVVLLCAVPMLATVFFGGVHTWALGLSAVLTGTIAVLWIAHAWRSGALTISRSPLQLPLVGLIAIAIIQLLPISREDAGRGVLGHPASDGLTMDPYATWFFLIRLIIYLLFFAAGLVFISTRTRVGYVTAALVIFGALMAFFAILQRLAGVEGIYGVRPTPQAIPFGSYVNQHHFAALLELLSGVALGLLFGDGVKKDKKPLLAIAAVVMGIAIVFTGSRGGIISYAGVVACSVGASLLFRKNGKRRESIEAAQGRRRTAFAAVAGAALLLLVLGSAAILGGGGGLTRGLGESGQADPTGGRLHFWQIAIRIFLDNPIIGAGFDAFGVAFTRYDTWNGIFRVEQAHNDYLQILADGGLLAFACVIAFLILFFRAAASTIGKTRDHLRRSIAIGAAAGCFGIVIHSFFDFPLRTPANAFFFLLLAALATVPFRQSER